MNKKIFKTLLLVIAFVFPLFINASNYNSEADSANNYILRNTYIDTYYRYLYDGNNSFRIPFAYANGEISTDGRFVYGGLLNKDEYILSKNSKGNSYLYDGSSYWTMTKNGSRVYTISYSGENEVDENNEEYRSRATEYVLPGTEVSGSGTILDPWVFEPMYKISFITDEEKAIFTELNNRAVSEDERSRIDTYVLGKCTVAGCMATIKVEPKSGYQYISNDCNGKWDPESRTIIVNNVNRDLTCSIRFGVGFFKVELDEVSVNEGAKPKEFYLQMSENFYRTTTGTEVIRKLDQNPKRTGYKFDGFYYNDTKVIDGNGNIIESTRNVIKEDTVLRSVQVPVTYKIKYDLNGGAIINGTAPTSMQYDKPLNINNPARAGYAFTGWTFNNIDTNTAMSGNSSTNITNKITNQNALNKSTYFINLASTENKEVGIKANWKICASGTYSDSTKSSCVACPSGYTSREGANSINKCYITVDAGNYIKTANTTNKTECPNGRYSDKHEVYYGSTSSCTQCPAGYRDGTGIANKTAQNKCLMIVPQNRYVKNANDSNSTPCATGYHKDSHSITYGKTSSACLVNTYTVKFDKNGGSGSVGNQTFTYGVNGTLPSSGFTRSGYTLDGWNTNSSGTGTSYAKGASVKNLTATNGGTVTLYAKWKRNGYVFDWSWLFGGGGGYSGGSSGGGGGCGGDCCSCGTCGGSQCYANTPPMSSGDDWGCGNSDC